MFPKIVPVVCIWRYIYSSQHLKWINKC